MSSSRHRVFCEINITPLTDIFLVLLIIMMVVAPMMQQLNQEITPPTVEGGQAVEPSRLTVEVNANGDYFLESQPVTLDTLPERLKAMADEAKLKPEERNVIVRADQKTRSAAVIRVFEAAQQAEFHKVTIAGQKNAKSELSKPRPTAESFQSFEADQPSPGDAGEPW